MRNVDLSAGRTYVRDLPARRLSTVQGRTPFLLRYMMFHIRNDS
jgi:hypothetical protein